MTTWEDIHAAREWGRWPETALVRFVKRTFKPPRAYRAVDLGCGSGSSSWFLAKEGFVVDGIDSSESAITRCQHNVFHQVRGCSFTVGDVTALLYADNMFDLAVDIACFQHLSESDAVKALREAQRVLKPEGWIFSMWLADGTSEEITQHMNARTILHNDAQALFSGFHNVKIDLESRTDNGLSIYTWIIRGQK